MATFNSNADSRKNRRPFEWIPMTGITLGSMTRVDNFVTSVTDNGNGDYTFGIDYSVNRTFFQNSDRFFYDVITDWDSIGCRDYMLQVRVEEVVPHTNVAGRPYVAVSLLPGSSTYTGDAPIHVWLKETDGSDYSAFATSTSATLRTANLTTEVALSPNAYDAVLDFMAGDNSIGNNFSYIYRSESLQALIHKAHRVGSASPTPTNIATGYNTTGGATLAIGIQNGFASSGTGSVRYRFSYRFLKIGV